MSQRLQRVVESKQKLDHARQKLENDHRKAAAKRAERERLGAALWQHKKPEMLAAIDEVNAQIGGDGLSVVYEETTENEVSLASGLIRLVEEELIEERKIAFNVSTYGKVKLVFMIPHSGQGRDFSNEAATKDLWIDVITDFLEQVFQTREKNLRRF